jgi:hypothetical protein
MGVLVWMNVWVCGCMREWVCGCEGVWVRKVCGRVWVNGCMGEWDGWDGWVHGVLTDGCMDERVCMCGCMYFFDICTCVCMYLSMVDGWRDGRRCVC